ncbi:hypothetical protein MHBO_001399 [Bonamia ostreae]|uniref:Uncharacterized protein n=1 Tax=Bonamia ostreae TaxID=126728 RepID=A0ABV2AJP9_9EUKA
MSYFEKRLESQLLRKGNYLSMKKHPSKNYSDAQRNFDLLFNKLKKHKDDPQIVSKSLKKIDDLYQNNRSAIDTTRPNIAILTQTLILNKNLQTIKTTEKLLFEIIGLNKDRLHFIDCLIIIFSVIPSYFENQKSFSVLAKIILAVEKIMRRKKAEHGVLSCSDMSKLLLNSTSYPRNNDIHITLINILDEHYSYLYFSKREIEVVSAYFEFLVESCNELVAMMIYYRVRKYLKDGMWRYESEDFMENMLERFAKKTRCYARPCLGMVREMIFMGRHVSVEYVKRITELVFQDFDIVETIEKDKFHVRAVFSFLAKAAQKVFFMFKIGIFCSESIKRVSANSFGSLREKISEEESESFVRIFGQLFKSGKEF